MYKFFSILTLSIFMIVNAGAQTAAATDTLSKGAAAQPGSSEPADTVYTAVDKEAQFPGGARAWQMYILGKLDMAGYSRKGAPAGTHRIIIKFTVSKKGKVSNLEAETTIGYDMEKDIIKYIKKGPDWIPAEKNGHPVNAYKMQTITLVTE